MEDAAAAAAKKKAKSGDQPFSRIPGLRDATKKNAKVVRLWLDEFLCCDFLHNNKSLYVPGLYMYLGPICGKEDICLPIVYVPCIEFVSLQVGVGHTSDIHIWHS